MLLLLHETHSLQTLSYTRCLVLKAELTGIGNLSTRKKTENGPLRIKRDRVLERPSRVLRDLYLIPPIAPKRREGC